jgi:hypothetical protein
VLEGVQEDIKADNLEVQEKYELAEDWQISMALEHLYNYCKNKKYPCEYN